MQQSIYGTASLNTKKGFHRRRVWTRKTSFPRQRSTWVLSHLADVPLEPPCSSRVLHPEVWGEMQWICRSPILKGCWRSDCLCTHLSLPSTVQMMCPIWSTLWWWTWRASIVLPSWHAHRPWPVLRKWRRHFLWRPCCFALDLRRVKEKTRRVNYHREFALISSRSLDSPQESWVFAGGLPLLLPLLLWGQLHKPQQSGLRELCFNWIAVVRCPQPGTFPLISNASPLKNYVFSENNWECSISVLWCFPLPCSDLQIDLYCRL